jgi:uncharacterized protein (TIGR03437 family)
MPRGNYCFLGFWGFLLFASAAAAQGTSFSFSNFNFTLNTANNTYTLYGTSGTGSASFSGLGNATVNLVGFNGTRDRGLKCGDYLQMALTFVFNANDTLTIGFTWPLDSLGTPQPFNVTGGTGAYQGRGGSGTATIAVASQGSGGTVLSGSGSGTLTSQPPAAVASILPVGIAPVFSAVPMIQPGSWISIFGANLANTTALWNGDFPTSLGGVSVSIDNKPGYLWYVSPGQINVQAPDDATLGCVNVSVTTPNGTAISQITLQPQQPSFSLGNAKYVVGEISVPDGSGTYGSGIYSYDLVGPSGTFSYKTRPVKVGETVVLYGVGFGPTVTRVPAGQFPAASTTTTILPNVTIGGAQARVAYSGLIGAGLYQLNVVVPPVPSGDQLIQATVAAPNPILFSSDTTQNCYDDDPQGAVPTNCAIYITVQ